MAIVDFPEPVRPSRPTRSFALRLNEIPCRTVGRSGAYLTVRFSTCKSGFSGPPVDEGQ